MLWSRFSVLLKFDVAIEGVHLLSSQFAYYSYTCFNSNVSRAAYWRCFIFFWLLQRWSNHVREVLANPQEPFCFREPSIWQDELLVQKQQLCAGATVLHEWGAGGSHQGDPWLHWQCCCHRQNNCGGERQLPDSHCRPLCSCQQRRGCALHCCRSSGAILFCELNLSFHSTPSNYKLYFELHVKLNFQFVRVSDLWNLLLHVHNV